MNEREFSEIKEKLSKKALEMAQTKGRQEAIVEEWKSKYGVSTLDEAKAKLEELKKEAEDRSRKRDEHFEKLKSMVNWEAV